MRFALKALLAALAVSTSLAQATPLATIYNPSATYSLTIASPYYSNGVTQPPGTFTLTPGAATTLPIGCIAPNTLAWVNANDVIVNPGTEVWIRDASTAGETLIAHQWVQGNGYTTTTLTTRFQVFYATAGNPTGARKVDIAVSPSMC